MANEKKFHVGIKALVQDDEGKILLLQINPNELKDNKHGTYWDLPGGRIKKGDTAEETLKKEIEEELGSSKGLKILGLFHGNISNIEIPINGEKYGLVLFVYLCKLDSKQIKISFEHTDYKWASVDEAKNLLGVKFSKDFVEKLDSLKQHKVR